MGLKDYCFDGTVPCDLAAMATDGTEAGVEKEDKADYLRRTRKNLLEMAELQEKLYVQGREGIVVVLQAMDAAGKDSTIRHVMSTIDPQGVEVVSFKQPTADELAHDYLRRAVLALPRRGKIAIFNRSYYEDVLVVQVHSLHRGYRMARRCLQDGDFFRRRCRQIRNFEEYLYENSYRVVKIFLNVSEETQKKRFLERIDDPAKNWKFSAGDLKEREHWQEYRRVYGEVISETAAPHAPWYVIPADKKWYARWLVSEAVLKTLRQCEPEYPVLSDVERTRLAACKAALLEEKTKLR